MRRIPIHLTFSLVCHKLEYYVAIFAATNGVRRKRLQSFRMDEKVMQFTMETSIRQEWYVLLGEAYRQRRLFAHLPEEQQELCVESLVLLENNQVSNTHRPDSFVAICTSAKEAQSTRRILLFCHAKSCESYDICYDLICSATKFGKRRVLISASVIPFKVTWGKPIADCECVTLLSLNLQLAVKSQLSVLANCTALSKMWKKKTVIPDFEDPSYWLHPASEDPVLRSSLRAMLSSSEGFNVAGTQFDASAQVEVEYAHLGAFVLRQFRRYADATLHTFCDNLTYNDLIYQHVRGEEPTTSKFAEVGAAEQAEIKIAKQVSLWLKSINIRPCISTFAATFAILFGHFGISWASRVCEEPLSTENQLDESKNFMNVIVDISLRRQTSAVLPSERARLRNDYPSISKKTTKKYLECLFDDPFPDALWHQTESSVASLDEHGDDYNPDDDVKSDSYCDDAMQVDVTVNYPERRGRGLWR